MKMTDDERFNSHEVLLNLISAAWHAGKKQAALNVISDLITEAADITVLHESHSLIDALRPKDWERRASLTSENQ